jgi:hypothetical protein
MKKLLASSAISLLSVAAVAGSDSKWWSDYGGNAANSHASTSIKSTNRT